VQRDLSRELMSFLVNHERMQQFMHFGAEAGETVKSVLRMGSKIDAFFSQTQSEIIPININILILAGIWVGIWNEVEPDELKKDMEQVVLSYQTDPNYKSQVDQYISSFETFRLIVENLRQSDQIIVSKIRK
jgi:F0F1-type ATP synthase alpha subunit